MLARIIDAEFFVTHFVYFPCMRLLTRQAVFCGSNGLWQTQVLQGTSFDPAMQTEDIDVAVRMLLEQHRIDFCPEARSGELAPISLGALLKQRTRWAIGWDQVSLQLFSRVFSADAKGMRKAAVAYVCWSRWWMQMVGLFAGIITPLLTFLQRFSPDFCHCGMATQLLQTCMFYFFLILFLGCMLEAAFQTHHRGCQSWIQVIFVCFFMGVGAFYIIFQAYLIIVSLFRIGTGTVGGWVVTARKAHATNVLVQEPMDEEQAGGELVVAACEEGRNRDLAQRSTSPLKMSL
jgi:cellulose synthase/poly-beta-1,6-N-acetylglucosamine synthase-like glycosyltransferase